jgi:hypothetical protein
MEAIVPLSLQAGHIHPVELRDFALHLVERQQMERATGAFPSIL